MLKDIVMLGVLIGLLSDTVKLISNYVMYLLGWTYIVFWQIVATRFLEKNFLFKPIALFIGAVADLTFTAVLGVVFVFFIYLFGRKYLFLKGIGYGLFVWVSIFGTLLGQAVQDKLPQSPSNIMVTIIAHFVFGLSLAIFTKLFYNYELINEESTQFNKVFKKINWLAPEPLRKPTIPYNLEKKLKKPRKLRIRKN